MKTYTILFTIIFLATIAACTVDKNSPDGFSLPEGDIERGKQAFLKYQCLSCHKLDGMESDNSGFELKQPVQLGGKLTKVTTYAELVTSIINPSHKISPRYKDQTDDSPTLSKMRNYNDVMTVSELVDIVSFLQPKYKIKPYHYSPYAPYYIQ